MIESISHQETGGSQGSGDRRQETGVGRQEIIFIYSSHFPTSPLPHFPNDY
ncbi:hypothetical protein PN467_18530 [Microcystis aeruginosa CS-563/04]|uniref:hypothetical protein n=1 Tax=Microcystis aeruginosa TaxID=1126 RepID=UPI00232FCAC4|nr:hypothetical protein [Microcystis aeruginosa]MDB9422451.1 hypothetical protein [Microcystis aeruginosa CS-563/04]NCR09578.1 hypothetical protein [Microcystis aeruginosa LG13-11]